MSAASKGWCVVAVGLLSGAVCVFFAWIACLACVVVDTGIQLAHEIGAELTHDLAIALRKSGEASLFFLLEYLIRLAEWLVETFLPFLPSR